jgi:hypothetical protein
MRITWRTYHVAHHYRRHNSNLFFNLDKVSNFFRPKRVTILNTPTKEDFYTLQDEGFIASWDKQTGERIQKVTQAARLGYLDEIQAKHFFDNIDDTIRRTWYDQTLKPEQIAPIEASYKFDKITDYGLTLFCNLIVGKTGNYISHMGIGDGLGTTYEYQDVLFAEKVRYAFGDAGYINSLGRSLRYHMTFDIMEASANYSEIGLFNTSVLNTGPMIARSVFDPAVVHTSGFNYITGSYLITTLSA